MVAYNYSNWLHATMWLSLHLPKPLLSRESSCSVGRSSLGTAARLPRPAQRPRLAITCEYARRPQQPGQPTQFVEQQPRQQQAYDYPPPPSTARPPPGPPPGGPGGSKGPGDDGGGMSNLTKAFIAGAFILGMGAGIMFDYEVSFEPQNVASTVLVDTKTPNSEICMASGYSSMVFDQRIFVSFNP
jgi:hypothetical protein